MAAGTECLIIHVRPPRKSIQPDYQVIGAGNKVYFASLTNRFVLSKQKYLLIEHTKTGTAIPPYKGIGRNKLHIASKIIAFRFANNGETL